MSFHSHVFYALSLTQKQVCNLHCVKSVRIRSFSGPYFPAFGLSKKKYSISLRIQSECWKIRTRKTPNADTFHAVLIGSEDFIISRIVALDLLGCVRLTYNT